MVSPRQEIYPNKTDLQELFENSAIFANGAFDRMQGLKVRLAGFLALDAEALPEIVRPLVSQEVDTISGKLQYEERLFRAGLDEFAEWEERYGSYNQAAPIATVRNITG